MNRHRSSAPPTAHGPGLSSIDDLRLDLLHNPFAPSVHVFDALADAESLLRGNGGGENRLRQRMATHLGVQPDQLILANGMDELIDMVLLWRGNLGPVVLFPPTDSGHRQLIKRHAVEIIQQPRRSPSGIAVPGESSDDATGTAIVQSPNDPTGALLSPADAVRLARGHEIVLIDERHGAYAARDLLRLAQEFNNVIVARTFETWAGLAGLPFAYAVAPKRIAAAVQEFARPSGIASGAAIAAIATLDDMKYMQATIRRVREERTRLWRMLRKLNMLSVPYSSSANFVLARIERGDARMLQSELGRRGIIVHRPGDSELRDDHLRFSATTPEQTEALKRALIETAGTMLG